MREASQDNIGSRIRRLLRSRTRSHSVDRDSLSIPSHPMHTCMHGRHIPSRPWPHEYDGQVQESGAECDALQTRCERPLRNAHTSEEQPMTGGAESADRDSR
eukprot:GHVU01013533.1.p4 GENE.GHVU01013533.1~~GHVU01013533.1.p4  ORF type:complete len:102 (-),score=5.90 GHVU01013533.1:476-781(-)